MDILNDESLDNLMERIDDLPVQLYGTFDDSNSIDIKLVSGELTDNEKKQVPTQRDHNQLFLNEEFLNLADYILENTFFNVIQEATRKECDLLRISRTYLTPNK